MAVSASIRITTTTNNNKKLKRIIETLVRSSRTANMKRLEVQAKHEDFSFFFSPFFCSQKATARNY